MHLISQLNQQTQDNQQNTLHRCDTINNLSGTSDNNSVFDIYASAEEGLSAVCANEQDQDRLSAVISQRNTSKGRSNTKTNRGNTDQGTTGISTIVFKPSDTTLGQQNTTTTEMASNGDSPAKGKSVEEMLTEISTSLTALRTDVTALKTEKSETLSKIASYKTRQSEVSTELNKTRNQLRGLQVQMNELIGIVARQDQIIEECKNQIDQLQTQRQRKYLVITGIVRTENQSPLEAANLFLQNLVKVTGIQIHKAFSLGKGLAKPIKIKVDISDKMTILKNAKNLKNLKNVNEKPYRISEQLPPRKHVTRNRQRQIMYENYQPVNAANKLNINYNKGKFEVNGATYRKKIRYPTIVDVLKAKAEDWMACAQLETPRGQSVNIEASEFIGYTACVEDIETVNSMYVKIRSLHPSARHIICAFRIPHVNFHHYQDFIDDDEHEAGSRLLKFLQECNIMNRVVFVVRKYDGTHIGNQRFQGIIGAAKAAIQRAPFNSITGEHQCPWNPDMRQLSPKAPVSTPAKLLPPRAQFSLPGWGPQSQTATKASQMGAEVWLPAPWALNHVSTPQPAEQHSTPINEEDDEITWATDQEMETK